VLTITGTNFSTVLLDQAVKVGDTYCDIKTATTTELTCQIRPTGLTASDAAEMQLLVFLAASFEASCPDPAACKFTFVAPAVTVTTLTAGLDAPNGTATATLTGTGFVFGDTSSISLFIDGHQQTTFSVDSLSVVFRITNVNDSTSSDIRILTPLGFPAGASSIKTITFAPAFFSVSPNTGASAGGTLLTVTGTGFGVNTVGLNLKNWT